MRYNPEYGPNDPEVVSFLAEIELNQAWKVKRALRALSVGDLDSALEFYVEIRCALADVFPDWHFRVEPTPQGRPRFLSLHIYRVNVHLRGNSLHGMACVTRPGCVDVRYSNAHRASH